MLRLTLRSGETGRFLARVIHRDGFAFVLDYGDRRLIADIGQRLQRGFTLWRYGKLVNVSPQDPNMVELLADHFCREGLLVFLEEPTFARDDLPDDGLTTGSFPIGGELASEDELEEDPETELISLSDLEDSLVTSRAEIAQALVAAGERVVAIEAGDLPEDDPTEMDAERIAQTGRHDARDADCDDEAG